MVRIGVCVAIVILLFGIVGFAQCSTEVEDNNSAELADFVADIPGGGCIEGTIGVVGDIDFFYFDVSSPRMVTIETITNEDTEIALLTLDGDVLAQNDDIALDVYSSQIQRELDVGTYLVAVWEHGDDNVIYSYTLSVHAEDCIDEVEDNDSLDLADGLGNVPGAVCARGTIGVVGDVDIFWLTVLEETVLTASTETDEDTEIALLDSSGNVLASNDDYVVGEYWSWIEQDVLPGVYFVMVWEHGNDNVIYDYTLSVTGSSCISEIESNDDYTLADYMGAVPGQICASGAIGIVGDLDYYAFDVSSTTYVTLWTETNGDTEMALFDESGNTLAMNDDASVGDTSSWIGINLAVGTYYVAVREFSGTDLIDAYTLYVNGD